MKKYLIFIFALIAVFCGQSALRAQDAMEPDDPETIVAGDEGLFDTTAPAAGNLENLGAAEEQENVQDVPADLRDEQESAGFGEPAEEKAAATIDQAAKEETASETEQTLPKSIRPRHVDMNQRITLDLRNMDVNDAFTYLSLRSGANIVTSKAVSGRVTLQLKEISLQDIFDITLLTNNLAYEKRGDIFYIMTSAEYEERYGRSFGDIRKVEMYQLKYAIPEKAFDLLDTLKSKIGRILVDQESGTVLMVDTVEKIKEMKEALVVLERKSEVTVFNLQYAVATDVEERLRGELNEKNVGSIWADERSNQVVVEALPDRMEDMKRIIAALDQKTKEVLIDAKIIKVDFSDTLETGVEWEGMFKSLVGSGSFLGSHPLEPVVRAGQTFIDDFTEIAPEDENPPAGAKTTYAERIFFGKMEEGSTNFEVMMKFLGTLGETKLLSNPKLAVVNNQEARIHVGRKEAYITTTTTSGSTTTTTAEDVNFVDIGIQLSVTPTINDDGYVTMKIKPEVSSRVDTLITPSGNQIPIIDTSMAETTVMVEDDATIIIGGLRRDEETEISKRFPILSDIPLLGNIFKNQSKRTQRSELLVMISPHIVDGTMVTTGDVDPGEDGTKEFKDYKTFEGIDDEVYGPEFGKLEYKSFRD
ncbi:MAG TPA: secretin N-terminal domain-containing protein [Candidatus Omnitrophota bacterium]|nr:secretin N-terminal domain-containing protein [Candidatus Omnitrophota bacterium]